MVGPPTMDKRRKSSRTISWMLSEEVKIEQNKLIAKKYFLKNHICKLLGTLSLKRRLKMSSIK
jgi:hypothetical protein